MIILGLGSNLNSSFGNRFENIDLALLHLKSYGLEILKKSNYYETPSFPDKKNPKFINIVIEVSNTLKLKDLISNIILVEKKIERVRDKKNDPRTCDIDIIDFNGLITDFDYGNMNFKIPHIQLNNRNFVLYPLREILPLWIHPKTKESINILIDKLPEDQKLSILKVNKN
jgi:2-amino-4-hydroxy-6-hydroxymethyldihydropteridine diphosphokinase